MSPLIDPLNAGLAGRYAIQRELGRGGMATVFLAEDLRHRRRVAIKVLHPELAASLGAGRFLREIEVAARLNHPHILPLHESGEAGGLLFYVMPFAEGESLRQRLDREKQLPLADALRIAREVAGALDHAHRQGVVHRDIKPENILLQDDHAVVADFGIARAVAAAGDTREMTTPGVVVGTPAYMSPEQAAGGGEIDGRTDVYSLGCVLFEMLGGQPPFTGPTAGSLAHQHLNVEPRPVTELRPAVPEGVVEALRRALAKRPADRFRTAAEFAAALAQAGEPHPATGRAKPGAPPWRRVALAVAAAALASVAVAAWQGWGPFPGGLGGPGRQAPTAPHWILVAEFEGPADDSSLAVTARDLVSAALDQSGIVATVPEDQVRLGLERAGKPVNARVDAALARELAYRSSVRTVLEGKIGRLGPGYSIVLRVVDAESLKTVLTESAVAESEAALIPTLGRLARKLRAGLGEKRDAIEASREAGAVATSSFPAYRLFVQGYRLVFSGRDDEAIAVLREAIALDPDFALAWTLLGSAYYNLSLTDSAALAHDEALRRPERLTPEQRRFIEGQRAHVDGDLGTALAAVDRALEDDPMSPGFLITRGFILGGLGRYEEGLESTRQAGRMAPFGVSQIQRTNEIIFLCQLARLDEARDLVPSLRGARIQTYLRGAIELQAGDWAAVERIGDSLLADPGLDPDKRGDILLHRASAQAARGALGAAVLTYERVEEAAGATTAPVLYRDAARRGRLVLGVVSEGRIPVPADTWGGDTTMATLLTRGLRSAIAGDGPRARRLLDAARPRTRRERVWQGATPALIEARIEGLAGRWDHAARLLQPWAAQSIEIGTRVPYRADMSPLRWFLADAYERLGRPDSAAATLERVLSDPAPVLLEAHLRGVVEPFAHRRLALLYARMGRIEDAQRHAHAFAGMVRTPDPEIAPLIAETRAVVAGARRLAESRRR